MWGAVEAHSSAFRGALVYVRGWAGGLVAVLLSDLAPNVHHLFPALHLLLPGLPVCVHELCALHRDHRLDLAAESPIDAVVFGPHRDGARGVLGGELCGERVEFFDLCLPFVSLLLELKLHGVWIGASITAVADPVGRRHEPAWVVELWVGAPKAAAAQRGARPALAFPSPGFLSQWKGGAEGAVPGREPRVSVGDEAGVDPGGQGFDADAGREPGRGGGIIVLIPLVDQAEGATLTIKWVVEFFRGEALLHRAVWPGRGWVRGSGAVGRVV